MRARYRDFPAGPLLERLAARTGTHAGAAVLVRTFGISGATARSWIDDGLTVWQADRAAGQLGLHPTALWGDLWPAMAALDEQLANEHRRTERWVRNYLARHRFEPCSPRRSNPPSAVRRGRAPACTPAATAPSSP